MPSAIFSTSSSLLPDMDWKFFFSMALSSALPRSYSRFLSATYFQNQAAVYPAGTLGCAGFLGALGALAVVTLALGVLRDGGVRADRLGGAGWGSRAGFLAGLAFVTFLMTLFLTAFVLAGAFAGAAFLGTVRELERAAGVLGAFLGLDTDLDAFLAILLIKILTVICHTSLILMKYINTNTSKCQQKQPPLSVKVSQGQQQIPQISSLPQATPTQVTQVLTPQPSPILINKPIHLFMLLLCPNPSLPLNPALPSAPCTHLPQYNYYDFTNKNNLMNLQLTTPKHQSRRTLSLACHSTKNNITQYTNNTGLNTYFLLARKESHLNTGYMLRRNKLEEITCANRKIYEKINKQKSVYSRNEMRKSYESNASISRRLSESKISRRSISQSSMRSSQVKNSKNNNNNKTKKYHIDTKPVSHIKNQDLTLYRNIFKLNQQNLKPVTPHPRQSKHRSQPNPQRPSKITLPPLRRQNKSKRNSGRATGCADGAFLHMIAEEMFGAGRK